MFVVTEDGEVATVDWSLTKMDEKDKVNAFAVTSVRKAHFQACTAVERCPHFSDIFLTVGDWSFIIWQDGVDDPIFVSPPINAENQLIAARWSPTRAGVIITALSSGYVEMYATPHSLTRLLALTSLGRRLAAHSRGVLLIACCVM